MFAAWGRPLWVNSKGVATGLDFKASMLRNGQRVPADRVCHPLIAPAIESPSEAESQVEIEAMVADFTSAFNEAGSDEIAIAAKEILGWSCSYRSSQPEKRNFSSWRKRWSKARARLSSILYCSRSTAARRPTSC